MWAKTWHNQRSMDATIHEHIYIQHRQNTWPLNISAPQNLAKNHLKSSFDIDLPIFNLDLLISIQNTKKTPLVHLGSLEISIFQHLLAPKDIPRRRNASRLALWENVEAKRLPFEGLGALSAGASSRLLQDAEALHLVLGRWEFKDYGCIWGRLWI